MFKAAAIIPLVTKLGDYLKQGMDHYAALKNSGAVANPDVLAIFIHEKMKDWDPKVGKKDLLDAETRLAGARFLAGIAINISS